MNNYILGVIGGVGPLATAYFIELIVKYTKAIRDQDNIDTIILNHCSIPDRTDFIMGRSNENPVDYIVKDAKLLQSMGCRHIAIPCNTMHSFYKQYSQITDVNFINMIEKTSEYLVVNSIKKVGILATDGTINSKIYQNTLNANGIQYLTLDSSNQTELMSLIYNSIKANKPFDITKFNKIINYFINSQCEKVLLACTELSLIKKDYNLDISIYIDSLEVLAKTCVDLCHNINMD